MTKTEKDINEIFRNGTEIDEALKKAVKEAILLHKKAGNPIAIWKDGKVVWIPHEDIPVDDVH